MPPKLSYVIKFVADMDRAVTFYRECWLAAQVPVAGMERVFYWETVLALHQASEKNPAGKWNWGSTFLIFSNFTRK